MTQLAAGLTAALVVLFFSRADQQFNSLNLPDCPDPYSEEGFNAACNCEVYDSQLVVSCSLREAAEISKATIVLDSIRAVGSSLNYSVDVSFSGISSLPKGIFSNLNLIRLTISECVGSIDNTAAFSDLSVAELSVTTCELQDHAVFTNIVGLEKLSLVNSNLAALSMRPPNLNSLNIEFQTNLARMTGYDLANMPLLKTVKLQDMTTTQFDPNGISQLRNLEELRIQHVPVTHPNGLSLMQQLKTLSLLDCSITSVSAGMLGGNYNLEDLEIKENPVQTIVGSPFESLISLKNLKLATTNLTTLSRINFVGLSQLESLEVSNSPVQSISDGAFEDLSSLKKLKLVGLQNLTRMTRDTFRGLSSVEELDLHESGLTQLDADIFVAFTAVRTIDISQSPIKNIDVHSFRGLQNLEFLRAYSLEVEYIDPKVFDTLGGLKRLDISENPWNCNESLHPFVDLLRQKTSTSEWTLFREDSTECETPESEIDQPILKLGLANTVTTEAPAENEPTTPTSTRKIIRPEVEVYDYTNSTAATVAVHVVGLATVLGAAGFIGGFTWYARAHSDATKL